MAGRYMYTPFKDTEGIINSIDGFCAHYTSKGKTITKKLDRLDQLDKDDILFINAHCDRNLDKIGDNARNELTSRELADQLTNASPGGEGLKNSHKHIKLWLCGAGFGAKKKQGFAWNFWNYMHNTKGFKKLTVYAWQENTFDPVGGEQKAILRMEFDDAGHPISGHQLPGKAKDWRIAITPKGAVVSGHKVIDYDTQDQDLKKERDHQKMKLEGQKVLGFTRGAHDQGQFYLQLKMIDGKPLLLVSSKEKKPIGKEHKAFAERYAASHECAEGTWFLNENDKYVFTVTREGGFPTLDRAVFRQALTELGCANKEVSAVRKPS